jgi:transcriptional regulator GlxA family with amidase domain
MRESDQTRQVPVVILSSRLLSLDDVKRIERHMLVTLQSKGILVKDEEIVALSRVLFGTDMLPQHTSALVKRAVVYLHQNYRHTLSRFNIAEALNVSEDYFSRIFRQEMNLSPWEYLNRYRILRAKELLRSTGDGVKNVAFRVGFSNPAYFSRMFRKVTGTSPSAYRASPE